jgi:hypothetical protein
MTLEELKTKIPESLQPWVNQYGPVFVGMTTQEIYNWIELLSKGDIYAAYKDILAKMPNKDLFDEWSKINAQWVTANQNNINSLNVQKEAMAAILKVLLTIALATVGL